MRVTAILWFLLLLAPALSHDAHSLSLSISDALITAGFLGLMVIAVSFFLKRFPEFSGAAEAEPSG